MLKVRGLMGYLTLIVVLTCISLTTVTHASLVNTPLNPPPTPLSGFHYAGTLSNDSPVIVTIYIPLRNINLLLYYAQAVSTPGSPMYHHFLSREEVKALFYPTDEYNEVLTYLRGHGFRILLTAADSIIVAWGNVSIVERYLGLGYAVYSNGSLSYYESYGVPKLGNIMVYSSNLTMLLLQHPQLLIMGGELGNILPGYVKGAVNLTYPMEAYWPTELQRVYNATALYREGYYGQNYTIGILDFFGDPYITSQLAYFDNATGLPNPPSFSVVPIGPYNPNLGVYNGWAYEVSLDVEVAHAMAPRANIVLYVANPALPLAAIIAYIVDQDAVNVVSQSFGFPESILPMINGPAFYFNIVLTDEYYALGSVEGITFLASSGDGGGAGYSNGPLGTVIYPAASPYVTAVGGTTTYIQLPNGSYYQTAWSSYGFIPLGLNLGGSTGGVSVVEPKPWYQWGIATPATYPFGRMVPDLAMDASPYPGLLMVGPGNTLLIAGGTSASSPLLAGLLTLIMDAVGSSLGSLNPTIYELANSGWYGKAIVPITFGYNIPWTAHYGYNLVTGLGTVNAGYLAEAFSALSRLEGGGLSITVNVYNTTGGQQRYYYPGEEVVISASILNSTRLVTSGSFYALIESVWGNVTTVPLRFSGINGWTASVALPSNATGILDIIVYGEAGGLKGYGYTTIYSGYYGQFLQPLPFTPLYLGSGIRLVVNLTTPVGGVPLNVSGVTALIYYYNALNNSYSLIGNVTLRPYPYFAHGNVTYIFVGELPSNLPTGVLFIRLLNAFGFVPFVNGVMMQSMYVLPTVVAQPGSVAPGGSVVVVGYPIPPLNLVQVSLGTGTYVFYDVLYGSNVTAYLTSPTGRVISMSNVLFNPSVNAYYGVLKVPSNATPGLYTIILNATYSSYTLNATITGSYFTQIYVAGGYSLPSVRVSSTYAFEGQVITIYANITYPNGTEVKYGMYSATVYPLSLSGLYPLISQVFETPLWYNPRLGLWVGNVTLPSQYSLGSLTYLGGNLYFSSPYGVLVTGTSADGYPTPSSLSTQYTLYVIPYTMLNGATLSGIKAYHMALINDTLIGGVYVDSILINDTLIGNVTLVNCNASELTVINSHLLLVSSSIGRVRVINSTVELFSSRVGELDLSSSTYVNENSVISSIYPKPPIVIINSPVNGTSLTGLVTVNFTVIGNDVLNVSLYLNNHVLIAFTGNGTFTYTLNTTDYPDGAYELSVVAVQSSGAVASSSVEVNLANELLSLSGGLSRLTGELASNATAMRKALVELNSNLTMIEILLLVSLALSAAALAWFAASRVKSA